MKVAVLIGAILGMVLLYLPPKITVLDSKEFGPEEQEELVAFIEKYTMTEFVEKTRPEGTEETDSSTAS